MRHGSALALDRWPRAPEVSFPAPKIPANDTVAGLLDRGAAVFEAADERRRGLERYLAALKASMDGLCREAEKPETTRDDLTAAIAVLLRRERERAKAALPVIGRIRGARKKFGRSKAGTRYRFYQAWENAFAPIEEALVSELETVRDARLRLEIRRADLINEGKGDGPIFASGKDAVTRLRSLRK